jgi:hypothetical protein
MIVSLEIPKDAKADYWYRVSASMFDRMIETGVIDRESRVELLDGVLVGLEEVKPQHIDRINTLNERLVLQFHTRARVSCQNSIELPQDGRPQPDFALIKADTPKDRYAHPEDVLLLIEIADTTLQKDRDLKAAIYARDSVAEYWILNLQTEELEVHRDPQDERYKTLFTVPKGQPQTCLAFPNDPIDWS